MAANRKSSRHRKTAETDITLTLDLDNYFEGPIKSGSPFLDHMLTLLRRHGGLGLQLECQGDLETGMHHSAEDIAICLGEALAESLGDKQGIRRYGFFYVPMDEALARVAIDLGGRFSFEYQVPLQLDAIGNFETEMVPHFFKSLAENARMNLHIDLLRGQNAHHSIEAIFKAFARALKTAVSADPQFPGIIPSTKGTL